MKYLLTSHDAREPGPIEIESPEGCYDLPLTALELRDVDDEITTIFLLWQVKLGDD